MIDKNTQGFTLVELMIAVAIVAILGMVASGIYSGQVIAAKRTDGRAATQDVAVTLDKCKSLYGSYNSANCSVKNGDSVPSPEALYNVKVVSTATTFDLTTSPSTGSSQANDTECTSIKLNHLGIQSGTGTDAGSCW